MRPVALLLALALAGCASSGEKPAPESTPDCCKAEKTAARPAAKTKAKATETGPEYVTKGPKAFANPAQYGIGKQVVDVAFRDIDGKHCSLAGLREGHKAVVVLFTSLGCPVTRNYAPTLKAKLSPWLKKGVAIVFVNPSVAEELVDITESRDRLGWKDFTVTQDPDYKWSNALGAKRTADVFVIDSASGKLCYRGPIDDRIGINYQRTTARKHYLDDAITAVLAKRPVPEPALEAPGCVLGRVRLD